MKEEKVSSYRLTALTLRQINELTEETGHSKANVIATAIDRMYQQEIQPKMKTIRVGENNDLYLYAIKDEYGRYYPLNDADLQWETPDAKIYYDSGLYPGITIEELPQYICNKAGDAEA